MLFKKKNTFSPLEISFYFFPLSFILGSLAVNLNLIIFLILSFFSIFSKKIKIAFDNSSIFLFLLFISVILSSFINFDKIGTSNLIKSLFLLKFFFLYISIDTLSKNKKINFYYFFNICLILSILVSLDLLLQFYYGKNILGYEPWEGRITGVFEHEAIAGAFLQKLFLFSLIGSLIVFNKKDKNSFFLSIISIFLVLFATYLASNRISFLIIIITCVLILSFFQILRKQLIIVMIILVPIFFSLYSMNEDINYKYKGFINKIVKIINIEEIAKNNNEIKNSVSDNNSLPNHGKIFNTAFKSFNDNKIFGSGLKSFRYECKNYLKEKNTLCSTHPHNYHLEVLHDTGLLGFIILTLFIFSLIIKKTKFIFSSKISYTEKIFLSLILINILIEIFPIKSTGSLFTTWNGTLLWISVALLNYRNYITHR